MNKRVLMIFLIIFLSIISVFGAQRKILVWNNDRGECKQEYPDVAKWKDGWTIIVWQDQRRGDYDIWGQIFDETGKKQGDNFLVNERLTKGRQILASVACMIDEDWFIVVWQSNESGEQWDIYGQKFRKDGSPIGDIFLVNEKVDEDQILPRIAIERNSGYFAVVWQDARVYGATGWEIYSRHFEPNLNPVDGDFRVNREDKFDQVSPDLGIYLQAGAKAAVIVCYTWEDYRNGSNADVYLRRFLIERPPQPLDEGDILVIDTEQASTYEQRFPVITNSAAGDMGVMWQDTRPRGKKERAMYTIYMQVISRSGTLMGKNSALTPSPTAEQLRPCASSKPDGYGLVTWYDKRNGDWDIYANQVYVSQEGGGPSGSNFGIALLTGDQIYPAVAVDDGAQHISTAWMDYGNPEGLCDIFYRITDYNTGEHITDPIEVGKLFGVEALYDDDEDYDDTTTSWNEDPRTDPIYYYESAKATIDMLKENNIDNLWQITEVETLPVRDQGKAVLTDYDVVVVDLGWRHGGASAGAITSKERSELTEYISSGKPILITGNDFGYQYSGDPLYNKFHISYLGDGNPFGTGNIETLYGKVDRFTRGMEFGFLYRDTCDNYVDRIDVNDPKTDTIFFSEGPAKVYFMRGSAWSFAWKGGRSDGNTSHLTFSLSGLISDAHPNTNIELIRRMMAFLGERVAPEPITTLRASTTASEGVVSLGWTAPMNQSVVPPDSAHGYILKFTHYENTPPDYGKMTTDVEFDAANTYYQEWAPKKGTDSESKTVRGLPPTDTLIFAIKAYDNNVGEIRNSTLGDEPKIVVPGDTLTPHTIVVGESGGYVKDFIVSEMMDIRNSDTLFFTWDANKLYIGYARHNWQSPGGDMFVYFDIEGGGADSTYPENAGARNKLPEDFQADYCFRVSNYVSYQLYEDNGASDWNTTPLTYTGDFSEDDTVNNLEYTEFSIPFSDMGYNPGNPFGFLVTCQNETNNNLWNSFPIENGIGKTTNLNYYYYFDALGSGVSPREAGSVLDIELSAFTAISRMDGIEIIWRTESENEIYQWIIEKKEDDDYNEIGRVNGAGNSQSPQEYTFLDRDVVYGHTYTYKLLSLNNSGNKTYRASIIVQFSPSFSRTPQLYPVSPNPARLNSKIRFSIPEKAFVSLKVYDISGRQIETVVYEMKEPGIYNINWPVKKHPQGVYFIDFQCERERVIRKITFLR